MSQVISYLVNILVQVLDEDIGEPLRGLPHVAHASRTWLELPDEPAQQQYY